MALKHAESGEVVSIYSAYSQLPDSRSLAIVSATEVEVIHLVLTDGDWQPLGPDDLIYLAASVLHEMRAVADSTVLLTLFRAH